MTSQQIHTPARAATGGGAGLALGAALVVMALVAGLNFTFSAAVMPNLSGVDDETFVLITQRFNENPVFPLFFTAAFLLTVLAAALVAWRAPRPALYWTVAGLLLYMVVLAITGGLHLPLNEAIDRADPADLARARDDFETPWVIGNFVRTVFCVAALAALARALQLCGRAGR